MTKSLPTLEQLWKAEGFAPNPKQKDAITYLGRPLFLTAGPGSGKTRVLLWRTLNLLVYHGIKPEEVYLSTFTEKAALQLQEGLRTLLGSVTKYTGQYFDLSKMYIGTIHSLCQRILVDRQFMPQRQRPKAPLLLDDLGQYLFLYRDRTWKELLSSINWTNANEEINNYFEDFTSISRHRAVTNCIGLFNRLSEECVDPKRAMEQTRDRRLRKLLQLYAKYQNLLWQEQPSLTDFSLLQQAAFETLQELDKQSGDGAAGRVFKHVIIDEYQDTNMIQEKLIFKLAGGYKNVCVVGDDDQALYRFRGATVENFVQFPKRCQRYLGLDPKIIPLETNYRSRKKIISFYSDFITHQDCNWRRSDRSKSYYRVLKDLEAHRKDEGLAVVASTPDRPEAVCSEIAALIKKIIEQKKVDDPNQIAFLFPSLKSPQVSRMQDALEAEGLRVYAPRARTFLEVDESVAMLGLFLHVFGKSKRESGFGGDYEKYQDWMDNAYSEAKSLRSSDPALRRYVSIRTEEIAETTQDYKLLQKVVQRQGWDINSPYDQRTMKAPLVGITSLSLRAKKMLTSYYVEQLVRNGIAAGRPFSLKYMITRATSLDWNVLDLFYRLCGFRHFRKMFDKAESTTKNKDEGPVCNLSLLSQYLARFLDEYNVGVMTARFLSEGQFQRTFFGSYLYALYRRGESEYEDARDPFPRGRIPFLTIHQAKGLEFPVVVLGNPRKSNNKPQRIEQIVQPLLKRKGEPLERMAEFDVMRMFYVALSRAKNLLVLAHYRGPGQSINKPFRSMLDDDFPCINQLEVRSLPKAKLEDHDLPKTYSYTGNFLLYKRCPRQYMIFRKYGFVPSRSQTMVFGNLVHETIDDLHQHLIALRGAHAQEAKS